MSRMMSFGSVLRCCTSRVSEILLLPTYSSIREWRPAKPRRLVTPLSSSESCDRDERCGDRFSKRVIRFFPRSSLRSAERVCNPSMVARRLSSRLSSSSWTHASRPSTREISFCAKLARRILVRRSRLVRRRTWRRSNEISSTDSHQASWSSSTTTSVVDSFRLPWSPTRVSRTDRISSPTPPRASRRLHFACLRTSAAVSVELLSAASSRSRAVTGTPSRDWSLVSRRKTSPRYALLSLRAFARRFNDVRFGAWRFTALRSSSRNSALSLMSSSSNDSSPLRPSMRLMALNPRSRRSSFASVSSPSILVRRLNDRSSARRFWHPPRPSTRDTPHPCRFSRDSVAAGIPVAARPAATVGNARRGGITGGASTSARAAGTPLATVKGVVSVPGARSAASLAVAANSRNGASGLAAAHTSKGTFSTSALPRAVTAVGSVRCRYLACSPSAATPAAAEDADAPARRSYSNSIRYSGSARSRSNAYHARCFGSLGLHRYVESYPG